MCRDCREQNLQRKREQFEEPRAKPIKHGGYESKSKKVWRDRFEAARKDLKRNIERYVDGVRRGWHPMGNESWLYGRLKRDDWTVQRYRRARAEAKAKGAI